jgi:hypothetical protein
VDDDVDDDVPTVALPPSSSSERLSSRIAQLVVS